MSEDQRIFVSIASYRDLQLTPTVEDLLAKADEPSLLRFGICWQHDAKEPRLAFADDERFQILNIDWRNSLGACWARSEIMKLWQGEQWFLQIDSHCRFIQGWDTKLIRMMSQTQSPKPILSTYANAFTPRNIGSNQQEALTGPPYLIAIETFSAQGIPLLKPLAIPDIRSHKRPVAARFLAAGFLFAPGSFVQEVPYDPELYFFGEEISMTVRAFTAGYDLFHPVENVAWHDYVRAYATRHWDDHAQSLPRTIAESSTVPAHAVLNEPVSDESFSRDPALSDLDRFSRQKVNQLLCGSQPETQNYSSSDNLGPFGLGIVRTREDYERYAGLSFSLRKLQDYTRRAFEPPNPEIPADWAERIYSWLVRVRVKVAALPPGALDDTSYWVVAIQDEDQREIRRHDFQRKEINATGAESEIVLVCEIESGIIPVFWTVHTFSRSAGWGQKLEGTLAESDFSIIQEDTETL